MRRNRIAMLFILAAALACGDGSGPGARYVLTIMAGNAQTETVGHTLPVPFVVKVTDATSATAQAGVTVTWRVTAGGGSVTSSSVTDANGIAIATRTLGTAAGTATANAQAGATSITFTATALAGPATQFQKSAGDAQTGSPGLALPVPFAVLVQDQYGNPVESVTVNWAVTAGAGSLSVPSSKTDIAGVARTTLTLDTAAGPNAVSATVVGLAGTQTFSATGVTGPVFVKSLAVTENYGLHDQFIRDGLAFLCAWNTGVLIYDVGNGIKGGSPGNPILVDSVATTGGEVHNSWWFHNPVTSENRYLFIGQEGPGSIGASSSGDIHVVDVFDLNNIHEVAFFHRAGAGTHNFWMDEAHQILYAAYYNAGVMAIDVSGTLSGDISSRLIDSLSFGGGNSYTWSVQLYNGSLYASDMVSGLWQLSTNLGTLAVAGGGGNEAERYTSDLWVANGYAYSGTWDHFQRTGLAGSLLKIWQLNGTGAPVALDSILVSNVGAVSDVEVSPDGKLLMFSAESGPNSGFWFYSLADPAHPVFVDKYLVSSGVHTATFGTIGGRLYAFGAKNPSGAAMIILDVTSLDK
jgi:hypothetical protein